MKKKKLQLENENVVFFSSVTHGQFFYIFINLKLTFDSIETDKVTIIITIIVLLLLLLIIIITIIIIIWMAKLK